MKSHLKVAFGTVFCWQGLLFRPTIAMPVVLAEAVSETDCIEFWSDLMALEAS
jgi:hypothetical protein